MYYGTKGWYVAELKKLGVRYHEGRKLESYRGHILRNLLIAQQEKLKRTVIDSPITISTYRRLQTANQSHIKLH